MELNPTTGSPCHESKLHPFRWRSDGERQLWDLVHAKYVRLFSDVICVFGNDFADLEAMLSQLETWTALESQWSHYHKDI